MNTATTQVKEESASGCCSGGRGARELVGWRCTVARTGTGTGTGSVRCEKPGCSLSGRPCGFLGCQSLAPSADSSLSEVGSGGQLERSRLRAASSVGASSDKGITWSWVWNRLVVGYVYGLRVVVAGIWSFGHYCC